MYTNERDHFRQTFYDAWQKHLSGVELLWVEKYIVEALLAHPEYHRFVSNEKQTLMQSFEMEENPFFHLSLHISIKEQLSLNRPNGIREIYQQLQAIYPDQHNLEHVMMDCLADMLKISHNTFDEQLYLEKLRCVL